MNKEKLNEARVAIKDFFKTKDVEVDIVVKEESKLIKFANDREDEENKLDKFEDLVLNGGGMVMIEPTVESGSAIAIQVDDTWVPAPPSEYQLEDGRVITVVEDGIIDSVVEATGGEDEEAPVVDEEMESEKSVKRVIESIVKEKVFASQEGADELMKQVKFLLESVEKLTQEKAELEDKFSKLSDFSEDMLKKFYSEPAAEPVVKNKNPLKGEAKTSVFSLRSNNN